MSARTVADAYSLIAGVRRILRARPGEGMETPTTDQLSEERALEVLVATQVAWNNRDLRALRDLYTEDIVYWTNWGGPNNQPRTVVGRQELIRHFADVRDTADIDIRLMSFRLEGGQARVKFEVIWRDPKRGFRHVYTCRNIISFANDRIRRIEEFQDAANLNAFQKLIEGDVG